MQAQLMSMKHTEERKIDLPPSLTHSYPYPLNDSTFQTYNSPRKPYAEFNSSNSDRMGYYEKDFTTYRMNSMMSYQEKSSIVSPPAFPSALHDLTSSEFKGSSSTFSNDCLNNNKDPKDLIYPNNDELY